MSFVFQVKLVQPTLSDRLSQTHSAYIVLFLLCDLTRTSQNVWNVVFPGNNPIWYLTTVKICNEKHKFYIYNISTMLHISKYGQELYDYICISPTDLMYACMTSQNITVFHYSSQYSKKNIFHSRNSY